jgi:hypothetical protein
MISHVNSNGLKGEFKSYFKTGFPFPGGLRLRHTKIECKLGEAFIKKGVYVLCWGFQ